MSETKPNAENMDLDLDRLGAEVEAERLAEGRPAFDANEAEERFPDISAALHHDELKAAQGAEAIRSDLLRRMS